MCWYNNCPWHSIQTLGWNPEHRFPLKRLRRPVITACHGPLHSAIIVTNEERGGWAHGLEQRDFHTVRINECKNPYVTGLGSLCSLDPVQRICVETWIDADPFAVFVDDAATQRRHARRPLESAEGAAKD